MRSYHLTCCLNSYIRSVPEHYRWEIMLPKTVQDLPVCDTHSTSCEQADLVLDNAGLPKDRSTSHVIRVDDKLQRTISHKPYACRRYRLSKLDEKHWKSDLNLIALSKAEKRQVNVTHGQRGCQFKPSTEERQQHDGADCFTNYECQCWLWCRRTD